MSPVYKKSLGIVGCGDVLRVRIDRLYELLSSILPHDHVLEHKHLRV